MNKPTKKGDYMKKSATKKTTKKTATKKK